MKNVNLDDELIKGIDKEFDKKQCIVAFLDILGFEEHVKNFLNPKSSQDQEICKNIQSALNESMKYVKYGDNKDKRLVRYKIFSDCTCLSVPEFYHTEIESTILCLLMTIIKSYTFHLLNNDILLRGGVSVGFHYQNDDMIFSDALIKAHYLESKEAIYPRTILDKEIASRLKRLWIDKKEILLDFGIEKVTIIDEKGIAFINPFNYLQSMGIAMGKDMRNSHTKKEIKKMDKVFNKNKQKFVEKKIKEYRVLLITLKELFDNKKACKDYLLNPGSNSNKKISGKDEEKIKEYIKNKRVLDKYEWLNGLIKWNINPKSSKYKFKYVLK